MTRHTQDEFEQLLLDSAKRDRMPTAKKRALVAALAGSAALGVAGTAKAATTAAAAKKGVGLALMKWIAAGTVGTALAVGATHSAIRVYERSTSSPTTMATTETRARAAKQASAPPAARAQTAMPPEVLADPEPTSDPTVAEAPPLAPLVAPASDVVKPAPAPPATVTRAPSRPRADAAPRASAVPTLAEELGVIERARTAMSNGDLAAADAALREHALSFPNGVFRDEASVLRIDLLARRGDRAALETAARSYLAANPQSAHAPRVRAYLEKRDEP